jgi:hypothetical protein
MHKFWQKITPLGSEDETLKQNDTKFMLPQKKKGGGAY